MASIRSSNGFVDPGWEYGVAQDERKKKVKCKYCGKVVSGGIYRLKQHLARVSGEVTYCDKAPDEVCMEMKENLQGGCNTRKRPTLRRHSEDSDHTTFHNLHVNDNNNNSNFVLNNMAPPPLRSLGYIDPGWEHGVAQDDRKKKVKCNYCDKIVSGGINRFKQHLARIPGEVAPCKNTPEEVYLTIKENMKWHRTGRRHRRLDVKDTSSSLFMHSDDENDDEEEEEEYEQQQDTLREESYLIGEKRLLGRKDSRRSLSLGGIMSPYISTSSEASLLKRPRMDSLVLRTVKNQNVPSYHQAKLNTGVSKKTTRKEVVSSICKFFYHAGVPINAVNSPYFHNMLELVGQYGSQDLTAPSSRIMSGRFLQEEIVSCKSILAEYKGSWSITGCSIMADSWKNEQNRTIVNFCVSCPRGVYFVSSVDATDILEDATALFHLLDKVVEEMGEENVVQVITESTPSYEAAGRMLEEKRRHIYWTPCAVYCIDKMLEDFVKLKWIGECVEKGQKITKLIYNRIWLLNLMKREFTGGQELLKPNVTKHASGFATLQCLLDQRVALKRMFQSKKWVLSRLSRSEDGKEVDKIVANSTFWKKVQFVVKSVDPFLQLLKKLVDRDETMSMPYIYNDVYRAKLAVKSINGDDPRKYEPLWSVIDSHWKLLFHHPLCLAAYFLNPSYRYRSDFTMHPDVIRGLNECIARSEPESIRRISASMQISDYTSAKADFGTELAICTRTELNSGAWWQQHGISCLELQRIAVRVLSQTCSSFVCEHNWSSYDQGNNKRQSLTFQNKLNEFLYVHYNLRLRERQITKRSSSRDDTLSSSPLDSVFVERILEDWIVVEAEKQTSLQEEDEEMHYNEMERDEDAYVNDLIGGGGGVYEDGQAPREDGGSNNQMIALVANLRPTDAATGNACDATDDDDLEANLNFLDDHGDLSD